MTRRTKKYSNQCGVLQEWNQRRRRYERKGQYVEASAVIKAQNECEADKEKRALRNLKASIVREKKDQIYIEKFGQVIRAPVSYTHLTLPTTPYV